MEKNKNKSGQGEKKPITSNENITKSQEVSTSGEGGINYGSISKKEEVEYGSEGVSTFIRFDEKAESQIRDLLQKELKVEVQEIKKDFLIIFGLFASFVTFISINVQVFRNNDNTLELLGICSLSLSFIIFFALIINSIVKQELVWSDFRRPTYIINLIFLIIGVIFITYSEKRKNGIIEELKQSSIKDSLKVNELMRTIEKHQTSIDKFDSILIHPKVNNKSN